MVRMRSLFSVHGITAGYIYSGALSNADGTFNFTDNEGRMRSVGSGQFEMAPPTPMPAMPAAVPVYTPTPPVPCESWRPHIQHKKVIFNDAATVVIWNDDTKTIVKCSEDDYDKFDQDKGYLMAYFQKHTGMSKTQCAKFMKSL
jgi:hypothetical protein